MAVGSPANKHDWVNQIVSALHAFALRCGPNARLFQLDLHTYEKVLKQAAKDLGLGLISPHMLRHGGASYDAYLGVPIHAIQQRGQWKKKESVLRYMKFGRYLRRLSQLPETLLKKAELQEGALANKLVAALRKLKSPTTPMMSSARQRAQMRDLVAAEDSD